VTKIRVATDLSPVAGYALERGAIMAAARRLPLEAVHVIPASPPGGSILGVGPEQLFAAKVRITKRLAAEVKALEPRKLERSARVLEGSVSDQLIGALASDPASLLVLGFRGRRPLRQKMLGGATERLVERSPADILVVKKRPRSPYRKVLICSDLGANAALTFERVASWCEGAEPRLLHVYRPPFEALLQTAGAPSKVIHEHREESAREAKKAVEQFVDELPRELRPHGVFVRRGVAPDVIVDVAEKSGSDLVVVGRNRGRATELFIGSVTKRVLRSSPSDVLVVVGRA
jgi:universal stress protein E